MLVQTIDSIAIKLVFSPFDTHLLIQNLITCNYVFYVTCITTPFESRVMFVVGLDVIVMSA